MSISYTRPLSLGWDRMKKALFQPFDITKWFRIGFTAWLASFTDCNGSGGGGGNGNYGSAANSDFWDDFFRFPEIAKDWILDHPLYFNLIIVGIIFLIIITTAFIWMSSRGSFMFLHNVANNKADISKPWHEYRKEGNSLFLWQFFFGWFGFAVFAALVFYVFSTAKNLYYGDFHEITIFWSVAAMVVMFLGFIIVFGYIGLFLKDFIVPLMYKHRVGVLRGWSMFLSLFARRILTFIGYGLFIFILGIAVAIAVIFFALVTCCIGLLLIALPYIGAVVLLPVSYTFRAYSIEFLAQFGEKYNVLLLNPMVSGEIKE